MASLRLYKWEKFPRVLKTEILSPSSTPILPRPVNKSSNAHSNLSVHEPPKSGSGPASGSTHRPNSLGSEETQTEDLTAVGAQFWGDGDNDSGYPTELLVEETDATSTTEATCLVVTKINVMANMITGWRDDSISGSKQRTIDSVEIVREYSVAK
ncbi:hypothetical protein CIB48_g425 [Xylaria polymorpha]|nr:hypothetical protein CIB48_g425 [Xylaria polymorpha]